MLIDMGAQQGCKPLDEAMEWLMNWADTYNIEAEMIPVDMDVDGWPSNQPVYNKV